jgi:UDP-2,3-diacylglucosamine hydrolase
MRKTYFFSDAHLGIGTKEEDRAKERAIVRFLERVALDGERLYILGDLFDYWFEYRTVVPKGYYRLFTALANLTESGVKVFYLAGNHDFWISSYFRDELGMEVFPDPVEQTLHGKRFYLHHGDGLLKNDTGYRILKRVLRNKTNIALFSLLPPDLATRIARGASNTSRHHTSKKIYEGNDMVEFAGRKIAEGFDFVVMGHNHQSLYKNMDGGVYANLGDWIDERTYAVFDGTTLKLEAWVTQD